MSLSDLDVAPAIDVRGLSKSYGPVGKGGQRVVKAVDDVSFRIERGRAYGLVGESGSGKSTIGRMIAHLIKPDTGEIKLLGRDWLHLSGDELRRQRRHVQMIFQSPYASLDPRWRVFDIVAEPLRTLSRMPANELHHRCETEIRRVGLSASALEKYPHQFSGGQRQRIAIARALITSPSVLIADEPVSALDVSIQAQILELLREILSRESLSILFISHDLSVVNYLCDQVGVLYRGRLVESGSTDKIFANPGSDYTKSLIAAVPGQVRRRLA